MVVKDNPTIALCRYLATILLVSLGPALFAGEVEVYPQHFVLRIGEVVHYAALSVGSTGGHEFLREYEFDTSDASRLRRAFRRDILDFHARVLANISIYCPEFKLEPVGPTSCQPCRELLSERRPP